jgi:glycosyltransferase involved in cell wall biosynthesis
MVSAPDYSAAPETGERLIVALCACTTFPIAVLTTVVIPTYNRRAMVREAVDSVLAQLGADFEVIVVDDGSTDGTSTVLAAELGDCIRLLTTDNRGVSAARNLGVAGGSGELIAFLDSDDRWLPGKLAAQVALMRDRPHVEICQTEEIWFRNGRHVNPCDHHRKPDGAIFERSLDLCLVSPSAVMMRRSLFERVGGFDESLPACEDSMLVAHRC